MRLVKKRATKLSEEQTTQLRDMIDTSIRGDAEFFRGCAKVRDLLRGNHWDKLRTKKKGAQITVNLIHSHIRTLVPSLFFQDPYIECQTENPIYATSAPIWESLVNLVIGRIKYKEETKKQVMDGILYGEGWKKWVVNKPVSPEVELGTSDLTDLENSNGSMVESGMSGPDKWFTNGQPAGIRVSPTQVIVDSNSPDRDTDQARFIVFRYRKLVSELKADPRYELPSDWEPNSSMNPERRTTPFEDRQKITEFWDDEAHPRDAGGEYVTLYEVWVHQLVELDLYKQVVVLVEDCKKPIRKLLGWEEFCGPFVSTYPITRMVFNPIPDEPPISEVATWKSLQHTLNWVMSRIVSFLDNDKQLYEVVPDRLQNAQKAKTQFYKGGARELLEVNEPGSIVPIQNHQTSRDNYQLLSLLNGYITQVGGIGQNQRGATGARTATEASIIQSNMGVKMDEKEDVVRTTIQADAELLIRMLRTTLEPGFVFKTVGNAGGLAWQQFTDFDAEWTPDVRVRASSFTKDVNDQRLQKYLQIYQMAIQMVQLYGPSIRVDIIFKSILELMQFPMTEQIMNSTVADEVMQMGEIIRVMSGNEIQVGPQDNHRVHSAVVKAFLNSPDGQQLDPQVQQILMEHAMQHDEALQMMQQQIVSAPKAPGGNVFNSTDQSTPASTANEETASDRTQSEYPQGGSAL